MGKAGNKIDSMKMYRDKKYSFQRVILFIELFANLKRFSFLDHHQGMWVIKINYW